MAQRRKGSGIAGLGSRSRRTGVDPAEVHRLEQKKRGLERATQHWLSLVRDMEANGESGDSRYETCFRAYMDAKQQEKHADLKLFNLRQGLVSR